MSASLEVRMQHVVGNHAEYRQLNKYAATSRWDTHAKLMLGRPPQGHTDKPRDQGGFTQSPSMNDVNC